MENLKYNDGVIRLAINGDENRIISFAPDDIGFMQRYYELIAFLELREQEYINKAKEIDENSKNKNLDGLKLLREMCEDVKTQIDIVFGEGTSKAVFGNSLRQDMFIQFFDGLAPYINKVRENKIKKYTEQNKKNVMD